MMMVQNRLASKSDETCTDHGAASSYADQRSLNLEHLWKNWMSSALDSGAAEAHHRS